MILPCIKRFRDGSYLSEVYASDKNRRHTTNAIAVRVIEYALEGAAGAQPLDRLLTTILELKRAPAVIKEIERALQKEDQFEREGQEGKVLFPIRIDDFIFAGWKHHLKANVVNKHVGDFRNWGDAAAYKQVLERLIRDLWAEKKGEGGE